MLLSPRLSLVSPLSHLPVRSLIHARTQFSSLTQSENDKSCTVALTHTHTFTKNINPLPSRDTECTGYLPPPPSIHPSISTPPPSQHLSSSFFLPHLRQHLIPACDNGSSCCGRRLVRTHYSAVTSDLGVIPGARCLILRCHREGGKGSATH